MPTKRLGGTVEALAMNGDGTRIAARGSGGLVEVWTVSGKIRRLASVEFSPGYSQPLLLDTLETMGLRR